MGRGIKRTFAEAMELPKESILNLPLITILGREELFIENYKGIIEYSDETVRISTGIGVLKIEGRGLFLKSILPESITLMGTFTAVQYIN
ncbi:sporulation protein YqfC [Anaerotignum faecicola]|nr:sporulation protein YqfC [Anaerotignum faecicola]